MVGQKQEGLGSVPASDGADDSSCFLGARWIDSMGLVDDDLGEVCHL